MSLQLSQTVGHLWSQLTFMNHSRATLLTSDIPLETSASLCFCGFAVTSFSPALFTRA